MLTPYDWQEGIGHRMSFIEGRLVTGSPILALSIEEGIVIFTYRRYSRKIFEIYDQLAYSAIGQQSDVESLRIAALDFAHQEGFNRSEKDVTIRRVVSALSAPIKRAFADFSSAPVVIRALFAEVATKPADDLYAVLDYEGDFKTRKEWAVVVGNDEFVDTLRDAMMALCKEKLTPAAAHKKLQALWDETFIVERPEGFAPECVLLCRDEERSNRFMLLTPDE
jgi:proteasome alpha subunit